MSDVIYLYGFVPADGMPAGVPTGIEDQPVEAVHTASVIALVSRLPAATYSASALDSRLDDLDWVAARGLAHERVVAWYVDHGDVVPAPLFTLFSSIDALRGDVDARAAQIVSALARLRGLREWDVKLAYHRDTLASNAAAVSDAVRKLDREMAAAAPGRRFLLERKRDDLLRTEVAAAAHRIAADLFDRLRGHARETVRLDLPRAGAELPVVLSAALLVGRAEEAAVIDMLDTEAAELRGLGFDLSFSGPWAAYRFVGRADEGHASDEGSGGGDAA